RLAAAQEALRVRSVDLVRRQTDLAVSGSLWAQKQSALKAARAMAGAARNLDAADLVSGAMLSLLGATALLAMFLLAAGEFQAGPWARSPRPSGRNVSVC